MSPFPNGAQRFPTVQEVDAWLLGTQERRAQLHCHAASPLGSAERQEAFTAMSDLLLEAFEEIRIMSEVTREESQESRRKSANLRTHSHQLIERGKTLAGRMEQFAAPSSEAIHQAESRMLEIFKNGLR